MAKRVTRFVVFVGLASLVAAGVWGLGRPRPASRVSTAAPALPPRAEAPTAERRAGTFTHRRLYLEVRETTGAPIAAARVRAVTALGERAGVTDASGIALLDDVPGPLGRLEARAPGYQPAVFVAPQLPDAPEVAWSFELEEEAAAIGLLKGAVLTPEGPAAGALLLLLPREADAPPSPAQLALADEGGRFVCDVPAAAVRRAVAMSRTHGAVEAAVDGAELSLELPAAAFVEGRVLDDGGRPAPRYDLRLDAHALDAPMKEAARAFWGLSPEAHRDPEVRRRWQALVALRRPRVAAIDDETGQFRLGPAAAGAITLTARTAGSQGVSAALRTAPGQALGNIVLQLRAPLTVQGRVVDASTGSPIAGARVRAVGLSSPDVPGYGDVLTGADGRFTLETSSDERHSLSVRAKGYLPLEAGGLEGRAGDALERQLRLTASEGSGRQREYVGIGASLRPHEDGAEVVGVFDGGPAAGSLRVGDVILRVDGVWVEGSPLGEIVQRIVGEPGSEVELLVQAQGRSDSQRISLVRRRLATEG